MNTFRQKQASTSPRRTIDGFINAPTGGQRRRIQSAPEKMGRKATPVSAAAPRRNIGEFSNVNGYRSTDPLAVASERSKRPSRGGQPPARTTRGVKKQKRSWKKWALRGSFVTLIIIVAMTGFIGTKGYLKLHQILKGGGAAAALEQDVDPTKLRGEGDGRINVLLLGRGGPGHDGPDLTDTILVASIDPVNKKAALISVPRDLYVESKYGTSKINALYANAKNSALRKKSSKADAEKAGMQAVDAKIEEVLGVEMHYHAVVDFAGFEQAVNTVGGVTINVPEELRDPSMAWENNRNPVLAKKGVQEMQGKQALMYVRSRHGSTRGDFDRAERQRLFIIALKSEILKSGTYGNPVKVSKLMDNFGDHVQTDFSVNDMMRLYSITKGISDSSINSIGLADPPNDYLTTGNYRGQSIVRPKAGIFSYGAISAYVRTQLPDGYILKERAPVTVLNGTTKVGLATTKSDELKTYSYNVVKADNAPTKDYTKTIIVDLTGKNKYTKNYLEKRFNVKVTRDIPNGITVAEADKKGFLIILGEDAL
jgi:polyisoprenyl-teichoic acid--peptidoglycan teichoic acid transferase